jgi:hypothetical protein
VPAIGVVRTITCTGRTDDSGSLPSADARSLQPVILQTTLCADRVCVSLSVSVVNGDIQVPVHDLRGCDDEGSRPRPPVG